MINSCLCCIDRRLHGHNRTARAMWNNCRPARIATARMVDHASDSLVLHNEHGGEIIDVNTRALSLLGYSRGKR